MTFAADPEQMLDGFQVNCVQGIAADDEHGQVISAVEYSITSWPAISAFLKSRNYGFEDFVVRGGGRRVGIVKAALKSKRQLVAELQANKLFLSVDKNLDHAGIFYITTNSVLTSVRKLQILGIKSTAFIVGDKQSPELEVVQCVVSADEEDFWMKVAEAELGKSNILVSRSPNVGLPGRLIITKPEKGLSSSQTQAIAELLQKYEGALCFGSDEGDILGPEEIRILVPEGTEMENIAMLQMHSIDAAIECWLGGYADTQISIVSDDAKVKSMKPSARLDNLLQFCKLTLRNEFGNPEVIMRSGRVLQFKSKHYGCRILPLGKSAWEKCKISVAFIISANSTQVVVHVDARATKKGNASIQPIDEVFQADPKYETHEQEFAEKLASRILTTAPK